PTVNRRPTLHNLAVADAPEHHSGERERIPTRPGLPESESHIRLPSYFRIPERLAHEPTRNVRGRLVTRLSVSLRFARQRAASSIGWSHEDTILQRRPEQVGLLRMLPVNASDGPERAADHDCHDGRALAGQRERGVPQGTGVFSRPDATEQREGCTEKCHVQRWSD